MTKKDFIEQYAIVFLATWTANKYDNAIANGNRVKLHNPPVKDAYHLAEEVWKERIRIFGYASPFKTH